VSRILEKAELHNWGSWLDSHGGIMPRWEILFNITVLRLISFNLDYYWSLDRRAESPLEVLIMNFRPWQPSRLLMLLRRNSLTLEVCLNEIVL
jgi:hypothetical protein